MTASSKVTRVHGDEPPHSRPSGVLRGAAFAVASRLTNRIADRGGWSLDLLAASLARLIAARARPLCKGKSRNDIVVLGFSSERFKDDYLDLGRMGHFTILASPTRILQAINSLFAIRAPKPEDAHYSYYTDRSERRLAARRRLDRLLRAVLLRLKGHHGIDAIASPTAHYEYQVPWAAASEAIGLPFVAFHKEFTVVPRHQMEERKKRLREKGLCFPGARILMTNNRAVELFHDAGVFDRSRMIVTGLPRMDRLFERVPRSAPSKKQVVLFSFGHYSGGLGLKSADGARLFNKARTFGFVELFDQVHGAMGAMAIRHPDVEFFIKPKYQASWWNAEISDAIKRYTGLPLDAIPNCSIVETPAVELIEDSIVSIGINSTVLLEALVLNKPVIVPVFAEASGRHAEFVYLREEMDAFFVAASIEDMTAGIERLISGNELRPAVPRDRVEAIISEYLGFASGGSIERSAEAILRTVVEYRTRRLSATADGAEPQGT